MASRKKKSQQYDPFDEDLVFVSEGVYRKRRWSKDNKTNQYGWHTFGYVAVVQASDRATQIEVPRVARTKGVWVSEFVENPARPTVYITCPHCAAIMKVDKHRVKKDGELDPCVVCPRDECKRHVFMILKGWPHGPLESISEWSGKPETEWSWSEFDGPIDGPDTRPVPSTPEPSPIREVEKAPDLGERRRWFGLF